MSDDTWYSAVRARDARYDGVFFTGVTTTGIYCRSICPAPLPARDRCRFFRAPAEAEREGFRACFRCRPELAPGTSSVDATKRLAAAAVRRIEEGALGDGSLVDLARDLGVTERHLRRVVAREVGASPIELAQSKRIGLAKQLLHDTHLPIAEIAFASGFGSVRRFNDAFRTRFGRAPSTLRSDRRPATESGLVLRLDYRPPLDWAALCTFFGARATPGVESVRDGTYRRTARFGDARGWISVSHDPRSRSLRAEVSLSLSGVLLPLVARLRALFDLDAHPTAVDAHLALDRRLAQSVAKHPGMRLPGAFDGFETAVRAVLGQQVLVKAATTIAGRVAGALGEPLETPFAELTRVFPTPVAFVRAGRDGLAPLGMPGRRAQALVDLARAVDGDGLVLAPHAPPEIVIERLCALPGIGKWTAHYVAMRALAWPDALPAGDLVLRNALGARAEREVEERARLWRPWRAYAVIRLWAATAAATSTTTPNSTSTSTTTPKPRKARNANDAPFTARRLRARRHP